MSDYSQSELALAQKSVPAIDHYLSLLQEPATEFADQLRLDRHRLWLESALATHFHPDQAEAICLNWSRAADQLIRRAWSECGGDQLDMALIALGKLGAEELNLSSDVDLVAVSRHPASEQDQHCVRKFRQLLSEARSLGFVLRVDFDLRPGGRFGPLISSASQMQDYYWSQGETWERLALVRLRPILGPQDLCDQIQVMARKFSYRKFLDFSLFSDLQELRTKIQNHLSSSHDDRIHLKLAIGGIRDIELFTHANQIIHGGKRPELCVHSTSVALDQLGQLNILPMDEVLLLKSSYWSFRALENRVQIRNDEQTHWLDCRDPEFSSVVPQLRQSLNRIDQLVATLLGKAEVQRASLPVEDIAQEEWLRGLSYSVSSVSDIWPLLIQASALSHKKDRDERARREFLYRFIEELSKQGERRDQGLKILLEFVRSTRAKATFYSMLLQEPRLLRDLAKLFCASTYLGNMIAHRPELIDSFVLRAQGAWPEELGELLEALVERRLLTELIAAQAFLADHQLDPLLRNLSSTADDIIQLLIDRLRLEIPQSHLQVVALGKWGGRELGFRSDLDMIFISDSPPQESDLRLAKRVTARLTEPHRGGNIYPIDLRLRPSGKAGPMIVDRTRLMEYLSGPAQAWERQSYLRARVIGSWPAIDLSPMISRGLTPQELLELRDIRQRLIIGEISSTGIDLKMCPGGLTDIELCVQSSLLFHRISISDTDLEHQIRQLIQAESNWREDGPALLEQYKQLRCFEQLNQLVASHGGSQLSFPSESCNTLAHHLKLTPDQLPLALHQILDKTGRLVKRLDPIYLPV